MVGGHQRRAAIRMPLAADSGDAGCPAQQPLDRGRPQRDDDLRPDDINLLVQIGKAGLHLLRGGFAIAGSLAGRVRAALENIPDIDRLPGQPHCADDLGKQLTRPPNERLALGIFIGARRFADEHEPGVQGTHAKNHVPARRRQPGTLHASQHALAQPGHSRRPGFQTQRRRGRQGRRRGRRSRGKRRSCRRERGRHGSGRAGGNGNRRRFAQPRQGLRRDRDKANPALLQRFHMLNDRV